MSEVEVALAYEEMKKKLAMIGKRILEVEEEKKRLYKEYRAVENWMNFVEAVLFDKK